MTHLLRAARLLYGVALRLLPPRLAAPLRALARRFAHRLDAQPGGIRRRLRVPGPDDQPVLLVVAVGADAGRLAELDASLSGLPARLVWVVDADDPAVLGPQVVEWMPRSANLVAGGVAPDRVRAARMALLLRRWRPALVVVDSGSGPAPERALLAGMLQRSSAGGHR